MVKKKQSFDEIKRKVYLIILPCILLSTLVSHFVQAGKRESGFEYYAMLLLICLFIIGWFVVYFNRWKRFFELTILFILYFYYWISIIQTIRKHIGNEETSELGVLVVWLPLILVYSFAALTRKAAIKASAVLFVAIVLPTVYYFSELRMDFLESLIQLYIATIVYIVILVYSITFLRTQAEIEVMSQQLYLDPLTQIGNRKQIDEWMELYLKDTKEGQFSLIFFDLDRFKCVNDRFGHQIGDDVLEELAQVVQKVIGKQQYFGRWGGEEFMIVLPASECDAYVLAETIRHEIESYEFKEVGQVTASFGVTEFIEGDTVTTILERADRRLYESKKHGRNRVTGRTED